MRKRGYRKITLKNLFKKELIMDIFKEAKEHKKILKIRIIEESFQKKHKINFSNESVRRYIKEELGCKFKKIKMKNKKVLEIQNKLCRKSFLENFTKIFQKNFNFLFLDESGFGNNKKTRKGWVYNTANSEIFNNGRLKQLNFLLVHDFYRVIKYTINEKSFNRYYFLKFLKELVEHIKKDFDLRNYLKSKKICLIMDNVRFHKR